MAPGVLLNLTWSRQLIWNQRVRWECVKNFPILREFSTGHKMRRGLSERAPICCASETSSQRFPWLLPRARFTG
jgi:hypothetical protein